MSNVQIEKPEKLFKFLSKVKNRKFMVMLALLPAALEKCYPECSYRLSMTKEPECCCGKCSHPLVTIIIPESITVAEAMLMEDAFFDCFTSAHLSGPKRVNISVVHQYGG